MARRSPGIFQRRRLTPTQLRSVAELRFQDARCLFDSGNNARVTGAMYMAGFVIECLLKAVLLERHPNLQSPADPAKLSPTDRGAHDLLYRHELDAMLAYLPEVERKLSRRRDGEGRPVLEPFRAICEQWTVYARYSPKLASREEARRFLDTVGEVKEWLKQLR